MPLSENEFRFRASSPYVSYIYSYLRLDWPVTQRMFVHLHSIVMIATLGDGVAEKKLMMCFENAVNEYKDVLFPKNGEVQKDPVRIAVFTQKLIEEVVSLIEDIRKETNKKKLSDSAKHHLKECIYILLTPNSLKQVFRHMNYEAQILDARSFICD